MPLLLAGSSLELEIVLGKASEGVTKNGGKGTGLVIWLADPHTPNYPGISFRKAAMGSAEKKLAAATGVGLETGQGHLLPTPVDSLISVPVRTLHESTLRLVLAALLEKATLLRLTALLSPLPAFSNLPLSVVANSLLDAILHCNNNTTLRRLHLYANNESDVKKIKETILARPLVMEVPGVGEMGPSASSGKTKESPNSNTNQLENCVICLNEMDPSDVTRVLDKCSHSFHKECIEASFKKMGEKCPVCGTWYGVPNGCQPNGRMSSSTDPLRSLPGHPECGTITIHYHFPSGTQGPRHPRPGVSYSGTSRTAYLPDNEHGRIILELLKNGNVLKLAWEYKLVFTVGDSVTSGRQNTVVWNNIHHKTSEYGGPTKFTLTCSGFHIVMNFGYPDPTFLNRVEEELAAQGVTRALLHIPPPK